MLLDEFPLFNADIIDALRQPLESGEITIARGEESATFPARAMMVFACNPCPCGEYHPTNRDNLCVCTEVKRREYRKKISGPVGDRIDITRYVEPVQPHEMHDPLSSPEASSTIRERVSAARQRQAKRYDGTPWRLNADVPGPSLRESWPLSGDADRMLTERVYAGTLTRRGATRVHRVAWTVADLTGSAGPGLREVGIALCLRLGEPLGLDVLDGARAG